MSEGWPKKVMDVVQKLKDEGRSVQVITQDESFFNGSVWDGTFEISAGPETVQRIERYYVWENEWTAVTVDIPLGKPYAP